MPDSRDKASRWINVALVVAFMLAPVAWYVTVVNATNHNSDSPSVADVRPLRLLTYYSPPPRLLLLFDPAEYNRHSRHFALNQAVMNMNIMGSSQIQRRDETFPARPIPVAVQKLLDEIEKASAGSK